MTYTFEMRPSTPTAALRADLMAQARAMLTPPPADPAETQPEYGMVDDGSEVADMPVTPGCVVRVINSPVTCPLFGGVVKVYANGVVELCDLTVPAVRWKVDVAGVVVVLTAEAPAVGRAS